MPQSSPRERILQTAQDLFHSQGFRATGINQIIKEAKVAKASFYDHFSSKDKLGLTYLQEIGRLAQCDCTNVLKSNSDPREALLGFFDFIEQQFIKMNFKGCPMQNLTCEISLEVHKVHQEAVMDKKDHIRSDIREAVIALTNHSDQYANLDVESVTSGLYLLVEGAMITSRIYRETWPFHQARKAAELLIG